MSDVAVRRLRLDERKAPAGPSLADVLAKHRGEGG
jgi:hypothetical protein